ncbi:CpsD/CapB family tyrosine-protein kinase [Halobacillus sp. ACCC02827]|uniref:CpsD/CapB family tyrosine-protein kinase n=1 Tax=unclassified Halobacillus TaxID=2636472 RepID=UPI0007866F9D|nr:MULTISPECIES: CpsD/CapB family tyrosine-protein kinase [unclassified Halobacillus]WJE15007.1 CpsD/CapB family tyrosine-protein kinase [Halobacillus sp. ACCC02827]
MSRKLTKQQAKRKQQVLLNSRMSSTEQIRMVQIQMETSKDLKGGKWLITSPDNKSNQSLITSKLAISIANQGKEVLVIEGDIRNPSCHEWFNISNSYGWTDTLLNKESAVGIIQRTHQSNLSLLPSGSNESRADELWIKDEVEKWIESVSKSFDVVLINGAPYISFADAQVLASVSDGVVLVARENKTKEKDLLWVNNSIHSFGKEVLGVILQTG